MPLSVWFSRIVESLAGSQSFLGKGVYLLFGSKQGIHAQFFAIRRLRRRDRRPGNRYTART